jgi:hypothetical protein
MPADCEKVYSVCHCHCQQNIPSRASEVGSEKAGESTYIINRINPIQPQLNHHEYQQPPLSLPLLPLLLLPRALAALAAAVAGVAPGGGSEHFGLVDIAAGGNRYA